MESKHNIEAIYPLSPMQQGMLFHTLYNPASGTYFEQLTCTFDTGLNIPAFMRAWQRMVERYAVLRTCFTWEHRDRPLQIVREQVELPWEEHDWQGLSPVEQSEQLERFLEADRRRGFDLTRAPLMRLALMRIAKDAHYFVWSDHHLLIDGWSRSLVIKEVFDFYKAFCQGQDVHLKLPRPYQDYITWLLRQDMSRAEAFWREKLQGFTAPTSLGVGRAPEGLLKQAGGYGQQQIRLSTATTAALRSFAKQHRLTLNTLVQGAWALLLSHYSGEEDIVFGVTVSGRPTDLAGSEKMIGLFINTLPARVWVSPGTLLLPWLKDIQIQQVEVRQYEYTPLVEVQGWSQVPRGMPLFESIVVFQNYPVDASLREQGEGLNIRDTRSIERTNYPLTVVAGARAELSLSIGYESWRFDAATITQMMGHFQTLLEGMIAAGGRLGRRLSDLPLLTKTERQRLLVEWNDTETEYLQDACIHELFEAQAERTPDAVAVVFQDQHLTYRELNHRANQLAHHLQGLGVGPEVQVGVYMERSVEMIVGLLGILKVGGAYVPLDPTYPQARLAFMLRDAQVPVLLTQANLVERLFTREAVVICLDTGWEIIAQEGKKNPDSQVIAENLAYVIYTSGSTGRPKGVLISHGAIAGHCCHMREYYQLVPSDRVLQFASLSFDASSEQIFPTLIAGARLVLQDALMWTPTDFGAKVSGLGLTVVDLPPAYWHQLVQEWAGAMEQSPDKQLRLVIIGGEAMRPESLYLWRQTPLKAVRLIHAYGPTEATISATAFGVPLSLKEDLSSRRIPIGRPLANRKAYVLDRYGNPAPTGIAGELYLGGVGLARGYLNHPDLTAEQFIPNPFSAEPGARLYKTGDLARYLSDGSIEFLGRLDYQVKVRGFRIELGEIEATLGQHPAVRDIVVLAREDEPGDKRLVAYIVPADERQKMEEETSVSSWSLTSELHTFLRERLPEHMIPSAFVMLKSLPLLPNGKVDRRALPAPDGTRPELERAFETPRTPTEKKLAEIWAKVLKLDRVGIHDNWFELGGHSLLAIQAVSKIRDAFQIELALRSLFESPTIAGLAVTIAQQQAEQLGDSEAVAQILAELERLSQDEASKSLASGEYQEGGGE